MKKISFKKSRAITEDVLQKHIKLIMNHVEILDKLLLDSGAVSSEEIAIARVHLKFVSYHAVEGLKIQHKYYTKSCANID